jgi:hypothetical protein
VETKYEVSMTMVVPCKPHLVVIRLIDDEKAGRPNHHQESYEHPQSRCDCPWTWIFSRPRYNEQCEAATTNSFGPLKAEKKSESPKFTFLGSTIPFSWVFCLQDNPELQAEKMALEHTTRWENISKLYFFEKCVSKCLYAKFERTEIEGFI